MKHLKIYEEISNYQVKIFTNDEFYDFLNENRDKYHIYDEKNDLKSRIKYFDWNDFSSWFPHWLKKHGETLRFIVAYNDDDILGICKFAWFDFGQHYSMSYCSTNKNYYQHGISKRLLEELFKYFSETYPDDTLHLSAYSVLGWKHLRKTILQLAKKYNVKIQEQSIKYDYSWDTDEEIVKQSQDTIKDLYGSQYEAVSVQQATKLNYKMELPNNSIFVEAVKNTKGAELTPDGLLINITRYQSENQGGSMSLRTGVFYLPSGSPQEKYYRGGRLGYGGKIKIEGTTLIRRPIFIKGGTGGKAPESAYDVIKGKGSYQKMRSDVLSKITGWNKRVLAEDIAEILTQYNDTDYDDNYDLGYEILQHSKVGNTLAYAIQENIIAHAVRDAGFDSVLGWSSKKDGSPFISEIFDVREITYPMQDEESDIHSSFL